MSHIQLLSLNEPHSTSRNMALTPFSINEPPTLPEWATEPPAITAIEPVECTLGDADFTLTVTGTGFYEQSIIVFAEQDEPTTLEGDGTLTTGVNMAVWHGPDTVKVSVRNGPFASNEVDFTFNAAAEGGTRLLAAPEVAEEGADPDELEEEILEAEDEGDFKATHRGRSSSSYKKKR